MRIAMAQVSSGTDPTANLELVAASALQAAAAGARLLVCPEATMCRFGVPLAAVAEPIDGCWAQGVSALAVTHRLTIVVGMFTPAASGRINNTLLVAQPDGTRIGYHKIHLYDAFGFRESDTIAAGDSAVTVDVDGTTVGLATCYDIRFPALFTTLAAHGAQLIVVPASWGSGPGKVAQWQVLATARALDSATFVAAVGQAEPVDESVRAVSAPTGVGHSQLSDPFGSVVASYGGGQQTGVHDIDLGVVTQARETLGVLANRREIRVADPVIRPCDRP